MPSSYLCGSWDYTSCSSGSKNYSNNSRSDFCTCLPETSKYSFTYKGEIRYTCLSKDGPVPISPLCSDCFDYKNWIPTK